MDSVNYDVKLIELNMKLENFKSSLIVELDPNDDKFVKNEVNFCEKLYQRLCNLENNNININDLIKYYDNTLNELICLTETLECKTRVEKLGITVNYKLDNSFNNYENEEDLKTLLENKKNYYSDIRLEEFKKIFKSNIFNKELFNIEINKEIFNENNESTEEIIKEDFLYIYNKFIKILTIDNIVDRDTVSNFENKLKTNKVKFDILINKWNYFKILADKFQDVEKGEGNNEKIMQYKNKAHTFLLNISRELMKKYMIEMKLITLFINQFVPLEKDQIQKIFQTLRKDIFSVFVTYKCKENLNALKLASNISDIESQFCYQNEKLQEYKKVIKLKKLEEVINSMLYIELCNKYCDNLNEVIISKKFEIFALEYNKSQNFEEAKIFLESYTNKNLEYYNNNIDIIKERNYISFDKSKDEHMGYKIKYMEYKIEFIDKNISNINKKIRKKIKKKYYDYLKVFSQINNQDEQNMIRENEWEEVDIDKTMERNIAPNSNILQEQNLKNNNTDELNASSKALIDEDISLETKSFNKNLGLINVTKERKIGDIGIFNERKTKDDNYHYTKPTISCSETSSSSLFTQWDVGQFKNEVPMQKISEMLNNREVANYSGSSLRQNLLRKCEEDNYYSTKPTTSYSETPSSSLFTQRYRELFKNEVPMQISEMLNNREVANYSGSSLRQNLLRKREDDNYYSTKPTTSCSETPSSSLFTQRYGEQFKNEAPMHSGSSLRQNLSHCEDDNYYSTKASISFSESTSFKKNEFKYWKHFKI